MCQVSSCQVVSKGYHLAPLCQLPCHNPVQDVLPDGHIEDAAREYDVPNLVVLPIEERNCEVRTVGFWRSPALGCKATRVGTCKAWQRHLSQQVQSRFWGDIDGAGTSRPNFQGQAGGAHLQPNRWTAEMPQDTVKML